MLSHRFPCGVDAHGRTLWASQSALTEVDVSLADLFHRLLDCLDHENGAEMRYAAWLDSASARKPGGAPSRWSVLVFPSEVLRYEQAGSPDPRVHHLGPDAHTGEPVSGTILDVLEERLKCSTPSGASGSAPPRNADSRIPAFARSLVGAWFGYFGYEVKADLDSPNEYSAETPDAVWMKATRLVLVDHDAEEVWVLGDSVWMDLVSRAEESLPSITATQDSAIPKPGFACPEREEYICAVREALGEIRDGNSYEVCLTAEAGGIVEAPFGLDEALALYRQQRQANPAPYAAFLWCDDIAVLSSSPERFLSVASDGWCETKPIKGTTPRCDDAEKDARAARALAVDPKTRAENLMIVDLLRNDFSRVCDPATIQVPVLMGVESYATVHQLVSTIRGRLLPGRSALDLVRSCFPGGSMTGAPKPRTMKIIERLEGRARGVYSGALGYLSPTGEADLSIVIRTLVLSAETQSRTRISVSAGGAIVADSDPEAEYEEMLAKLRAPFREASSLPKSVSTA